MIVGIVLSLISIFRIFDLGQYLSLSYIKSSQEQLAILYAEHTAMVIAGYMVIYVLVTSLSLPGAVVLTLAGGALFGLWVGTLVVSFASTIGGTLACLVSRFVLRDWVQSKFGDRLSTVNQGIAKEGALYLFTVRLIPIFPFFVINLVMGLTRMPLRTFYWVSQIGMFPGTVVYINAGRELARLQSPSGILSPRLLFSFALLGLFPLAARKAMAFYQSRKEGGDHGEV